MLVLSVFLVLPKCLFIIIVMYAYFIDISQGSVETSRISQRQEYSTADPSPETDSKESTTKG